MLNMAISIYFLSLLTPSFGMFFVLLTCNNGVTKIIKQSHRRLSKAKNKDILAKCLVTVYSGLSLR